MVLADGGFDIADSVASMQATLHIPVFTGGKPQLSAKEVKVTRRIANIRMHVEQVIGLVLQKYPILRSTIAIHYVTRRPGENLPLLDIMIRECCALSTFGTQLYHLNNVNYILLHALLYRVTMLNTTITNTRMEYHEPQ